MIRAMVKGVLAAAALGALLAAPAGAQDKQASTRPKGCVIEQWPAFLAPGPQSHTLRERIPTPAGEVDAIAFGPLEGEYAKLYMFFLVKGGCERKVFVVGSYGYMNDFARQRGEIGPNQRIYHLDMFTPRRHRTLEILHDRPGYAAMRARALSELR